MLVRVQFLKRVCRFFKLGEALPFPPGHWGTSLYASAQKPTLQQQNRILGVNNRYLDTGEINLHMVFSASHTSSSLPFAGMDHIPSNDFSFFDHVLDTSALVGAVPARFKSLAPGMETYFAMGRGLQRPADPASGAPAVDVESLEMKKWMDSNYHFFVPELSNGMVRETAPHAIRPHHSQSHAVAVSHNQS